MAEKIDITVGITHSEADIDAIIQKIRAKLSSANFAININPNINGKAGDSKGAKDFVTEVRTMNVKADVVNIYTNSVNQGGGGPGGTPPGGGGGFSSDSGGSGGKQFTKSRNLLRIASGAALASSEIINSISRVEMDQARYQGMAARSREYFRLQNLSGDFSDLGFEKEKNIGKDKAQSMSAMALVDMLKIGGSIAGGLAFAPMTGGLSLLGTAAIAGKPLTSMLTGTYGEELTSRYEAGLLEAQQNEINKNPLKKKAFEQLIQKGSTESAVASAGFGAAFAESSFSKTGLDPLSTLTSAMSAGNAQRAFVKNIAEGTKLGMDSTQNAKEFRSFIEMLSASQVAAGLSGKSGSAVSNFNDVFGQTFSDVYSQRGIQAGMQAKDFFARTQTQASGAYGALFYSGLSKSAIGDKLDKSGALAHGMAEQLAYLTSAEAADLSNPFVQATANRSSVTAKEMSDSTVQGKYAATIGTNPEAGYMVSGVQAAYDFNKTLTDKERSKYSFTSQELSDMGTYAVAALARATGTKVNPKEIDSMLAGAGVTDLQASSKFKKETDLLDKIISGKKTSSTIYDTPESSMLRTQRENMSNPEDGDGMSTDYSKSIKRFSDALDILSEKIESRFKETSTAEMIEAANNAGKYGPKF